MGLLKTECKSCQRPLQDIKSQLRGIGPICYERPRCSKCHKPIKRYAHAGWHSTLLSWNVWGVYGNQADKRNPNGMYFFALSICCSADIDNVQIIYDEYEKATMDHELTQRELAEARRD
jgi:hypothetical protein